MPLSIAGQVFVEYAIGLGDVITKEDLSRLLIETAQKLGFDQVNASIMRDYSLPDEQLKFGLANTYSDEWKTYYAAHDCLHYDPVAQLARGNVPPFFWSELIERQKLNPVQKRFINLAGDAGMHNGIGLPFLGPQALWGGIALATSDPKAEHLRDLNILWSISNLFYKKLKEISLTDADQSKQAVNLSSKEMTILVCPALGETDRVIANGLGISENTVNSHLRKIYRKLGAHTRVQAFANALRQQIIDIPSPNRVNPSQHTR